MADLIFGESPIISEDLVFIQNKRLHPEALETTP